MNKKYKIIFSSAIIVLAAVVGVAVYQLRSTSGNDTQAPAHKNPLTGVRFYNDPERNVVTLATQLRADGDVTNAVLAEQVASQPGTTWLTGPSADDPTAQRDIDLVSKTSAAAAVSNTVPVYELYAIPRRDACAGFSSGGFTTDQQYLDWVQRVVNNLKGRAIFSIEADAVAHTVNGCFTSSEASARYELLRKTTVILRDSPLVLASYLDAGHPEWFKNSQTLVEPLQRSGVGNTNGVAVNVSYFIANDKLIPWAQDLTRKLGPTAGAIIDTSRNGNGAAPSSATGEARWCNPAGRAIGVAPTISTGQDRIDAFVWIKRTGESDGACFGHPSAGTFEPNVLLELVRNAGY